MYNKQYRIHFVGVGGIGMSGIAELLCNLEYQVSGSDLRVSQITKRLAGLGAIVYAGHEADKVRGADVVVYSSAVRPDNPELLAAKEMGIPVIPRAEMLAELMRLKYSVAISGSHGKTTTTSMVAQVLGHGGLDPTVVIGGKLKSIGSNARLGSGEFIVAEADESDGSFLKMSPSIAVVTNTDREHLDFYKDDAEITQAFAKFLERIPFYGVGILCLDNPGVQSLIPAMNKRYVTYGLSHQADLWAGDLEQKGISTSFTVRQRGRELGRIKLPVPGRHNVQNALAALAVGLELGLEFATAAQALEQLQGVDRRMEIKGEQNGVLVIDDYGHHPTEILATLLAVSNHWPERRLVVLFQPHRYSRTQALFDEFSRSFYQADTLVLLPIYAASESPIEGVDARDLAASVKSHGHKNVQFEEDFDAALASLKEQCGEGDLILTLGAGDVWKVGERFLNG